MRQQAPANGNILRLQNGDTFSRCHNHPYLQNMGSEADGNFVEARLDSLSQLLPEGRQN